MNLHFNLDFKYNGQKRWIKTKNAYFVGTVFLDGKLLSDKDICTRISMLTNAAQATEFVKNLNGSFAIAILLDGALFMASDRERTIPIFYEISGDDVFIYNHISLDIIKSHGVNKDAINELEYCLFVPGNKTMANKIFSVMAGEVVVIADGKAERYYYHKYNYDKMEYPDKKELLHLIDEKFIKAVKRLIEYLNGRCAVVPLSGGHDSRLVVYYLKKLGYDNIITYTYGPKGNFEASTSEKVAQFLNLKWYCVEYEPDKLQKLFKEKFKELCDFYSNGVSSVCVQDWYALDYLHKTNVLPKDSVFVPGHSFDAIAGSFILPRYVQNDTVTKQELINDMLWKHYSEGKRTLPKKARAYIETTLNDELLKREPDILSSNCAFDLYQSYNTRERQAKYICCQPKLYEYYGYDWYLPLWDNELIEFWETIDIKQKYNRKLFFEFTEYKYGDLMAAAPVENPKSKDKKAVNMNPIVRVIRKINQLINYVDFHYCLAYFTRVEVISIYIRKRVLNIGYIVNQKIKEIVG